MKVVYTLSRKSGDTVKSIIENIKPNNDFLALYIFLTSSL